MLFRSQVPVKMRPLWPATQPIRVTAGPQAEYFTKAGLETFHSTEYRVSARADRQGIRTEGAAVEIAKGPDIISDPTPLGAVQIPGDGQPIILHRDGQVTGGYAKIATVIAADLDRLGQMVAGDALRFELMTRDEALAAAEQSRQRLACLVAILES